MTRTLLQQAFDALHPQANRAFVEATKDALRSALAAPAPADMVMVPRDSLTVMMHNAERPNVIRSLLLKLAAAPAPADLIPPDALFVCEQMGANVTRVRAESAAPAVSLTDADIDRIADTVPVDQIGIHITTWHRRFARAVLTAAPPAAPIDGFGGNLDGAFDAPAAPADMVMVEALRKARKALDGIDATACCDHWANMNSSARRYAIARDARAAVQDIDRVLLAAAPAPADWGTPHDVSGAPWQSAAPAVPQEPIYGKYTADDLVQGVLQSAAPAVPLTDTRKLCTCDGAGRGPGRACVVQAGGRLGDLWKCAHSIGGGGNG